MTMIEKLIIKWLALDFFKLYDTRVSFWIQFSNPMYEEKKYFVEFILLSRLSCLDVICAMWYKSKFFLDNKKGFKLEYIWDPVCVNVCDF